MWKRGFKLNLTFTKLLLGRPTDRPFSLTDEPQLNLLELFPVTWSTDTCVLNAAVFPSSWNLLQFNLDFMYFWFLFFCIFVFNLAFYKCFVIVVLLIYPGLRTSSCCLCCRIRSHPLHVLCNPVFLHYFYCIRGDQHLLLLWNSIYSIRGQ